MACRLTASSAHRPCLHDTLDSWLLLSAVQLKCVSGGCAVPASLTLIHLAVRISCYEVTVQVDGVPLTEYQTEVDETTGKGVCWIESLPGQRFTVVWNKRGPWSDHAGDVTGCLHLDGSTSLQSMTHRADSPRSRHFKGVRDGQTSRRPYEFTSLVSIHGLF